MSEVAVELLVERHLRAGEVGECRSGDGTAAGRRFVFELEAYRYALTRGYRSVEASLLLEDNDLILRASETFGGKRYKTWRIYQHDL